MGGLDVFFKKRCPLDNEGTDDELYARFFIEARTMRRGAWRREFTARAINDYFRGGFGVKYLPLEELPAVQCGPFRPEFSYRSSLMKMLRNWTQLGPPTQRPEASSNRP